jgi:Phage integrase, N-terminal SAM-like domain
VTARRTFGSIRKLPSSRYQARYFDAGGPRHLAPDTFATKADASRWLADVEVSLARGTWVDPEAGRVSFADFAFAWLEHRPGLKPRTADLYRSELRCHIVPVLGGRALTEITPARNPCMIDGGGAERSPERPTATLAQVWALAAAVPPR